MTQPAPDERPAEDFEGALLEEPEFDDPPVPPGARKAIWGLAVALILIMTVCSFCMSAAALLKVFHA